MNAPVPVSSDSQDIIRSFTASLIAHLGELSQEAPVDGDSPLNNIQDRYTSYDEVVLEDGRKVRRFDNGAVRIINERSGVIQEERPNGNMLVSLPTGRVMYQEQPGMPILVYNNVEGGRALLGKVVLVKLGNAAEPSAALHFEDQQGGHFVDMDSLRYVKVSLPSAPALPRAA